MGNPKGNPTGSKPLFETPEEMQRAIDEYVSNPPESKKVIDGTLLSVPDKPTISGLCYFLGFESRQSFYDYEQKGAFAYTIKRARLFIESTYEQNLHSNGCTGSIFALKSMGWDDGSSDESAPPVKVEFSVKDAAADIRVTNADD